MTTQLSIGDFSRMTYLSVKALRHYHDIGVLEPAEIDPASGYRFYLPSQVGLAQMIRRLRDLGMPLEEVRAILQQQPEPLKVQRRTIPATPALAITERIAAADAVAWWMESFTFLHRVLSSYGAPRGGPDGAMFPAEFFEDEEGEVTAFVPVSTGSSAGRPARV